MNLPSPHAVASSSGSARLIVAQNVVQLRAEKGWSQERLGFEAGLHRTFIAHVERSARNISIDNLEKIATALGVSAYRLLMPQPEAPSRPDCARLS